MINLKCPNCGADIANDEAQRTGKCTYCNSRFALEKQEPKEQLESTNTNTNSLSSSTFNTTKKPNRPRPRLRLGLLILTMCFGPVFFVGYIILTMLRKKEWDKEFSGQ